MNKVNPFNDFDLDSEHYVLENGRIDYYKIILFHKRLPYSIVRYKKKVIAEEGKVTLKESGLLAAECTKELMEVYLFGRANCMINPVHGYVHFIQWDKDKQDWFTLNQNRNPWYGKDKEVLDVSELQSGCPVCGAEEISAMTPRTVYKCGSSDYDQRPGTFNQSDQCKDKSSL